MGRKKHYSLSCWHYVVNLLIILLARTPTWVYLIEKTIMVRIYIFDLAWILACNILLIYMQYFLFFYVHYCPIYVPFYVPTCLSADLSISEWECQKHLSRGLYVLVPGNVPCQNLEAVRLDINTGGSQFKLSACHTSSQLSLFSFTHVLCFHFYLTCFYSLLIELCFMLSYLSLFSYFN